MKILLIHNYYQYPGGEDTYFESLKQLLIKNNHQVKTYTKNNKQLDSFSDKVKTSIGLFYNLKTKNELSKIIKSFKPDIAQIQNIYPLISPSVYHVLHKHQVPIIQRISNYRLLCPKGILFRDNKICELCINKRFKYPNIIHGCYQQSRIASLIFSSSLYFHQLIKSFDLINHFIFPTEFIRDLHLKYLPIPKNKTTVIPTFTNIQTIKSNLKISPPFKEYYLYVGQFNEQKGVIDLLEQFIKTPKKNLICIGDGPLKKQVLKYQNYANIKIIDWQPKSSLVTYYKKAKAVIIPSKWYDPLPNVLLEAKSLNKSIIIPKNKYLRLINKKNIIQEAKIDTEAHYQKLIVLYITTVNHFSKPIANY